MSDIERLRALAEQSQREVAARFSLALEGEAVVALCDEVERLKRDIGYLNPIVDSLQPIGRALGLLAGADLTRECLPAIERLTNEVAELRALLADVRRRVSKALGEPNETMSDAKTLREIVRQLRLMAVEIDALLEKAK